MKKEIEDAIKSLAKKAGEATDSGHAMRYAQAALNIAQTAQVVEKTSER